MLQSGLNKNLSLAFISFFLLISPCSKAQIPVAPLDSFITNEFMVKSGDVQDLLNSYFQLAVKNLTSGNPELKYTTTIYALKVKKHPELKYDYNYVNQRDARNLELSIAAKADSSNGSINTANVGFKYALINERDKSVARFNIADDVLINKTIKDAIHNVRLRNPELSGDALTAKVTAMNNSITQFYQSFDANDLDKSIREELSRIQKPGEDIGTQLLKANAKYNLAMAAYSQKPLWTFYLNSDYNFNVKSLTSLNLGSEFFDGLMKNPNKKPWELTVKGNMAAGDDTSITGYDFSRIILSGSVGLNHVFARDEANHSSLGELKVDASLNNIIHGAYKGEEKSVITFNATLRIRLSEELWVPLVLTYDQANANLFGFLNLTWNFEKK
jgi:hypothetical protein